ncbi:alanine-rich protein [Streptomyces zinciresistens K42]|uniref:Alanine-rich protein n=1 Tax=Streptomyces zinciresistens K42 TaxID=700597 RepID=G2GFD8_9ACTN|nr:DUF3618 domain-containing protein [Streptomyces zinciresistens]EGX57753.1 alanine-rich protein [Streptomyces zinciresistens K42]
MGRTAAGKTTGGAEGPEALRDQIQRTRGQLGDTVAELASKADVKGRAVARAADLRDKAGAMTVQLRSSAAHATHVVQDKAARAGHAVRERAGETGHTVQDKATQAVGEGPRPVRTAVRAARRNPRPVLVVGAALGALVAAGAIRRRNSR